MPKPLLLASLLLLAAAAIADEPKTWEFRGAGNWEELKHAPASQPAAADPTLDRLEQLVANRQYLAAKRQAIQWIRTHGKDAPMRDRAVYLLGQANFGYGDRIQAFYNFDEVLDLYPDSPLFNPALQREYDIADAYLNGYKRRFFGGLFKFGAEDEAIEMLYRIQQRSPGSPLAEKSLLRTGDYYYRDSQFDLAADVYAAFVRSFPRSPEIPRVRLRQAFSYYAQFRGLKYDATPIIDAREQLVGIMQQYPKLAEEENIAPVITRIDEAYARKLYLRGDFYKRTHQPRAAVYTWRYLVQTYPKSADAELARKAIARMPKSALDGPMPPVPGEQGIGPTTAPTVRAD
jgi:outer membrane assembly lipoprotein YfiO